MSSKEIAQSGRRLAKEYRKNIFSIGEEILRPNELPSITVYGKNLSEAWEAAVIATLTFGCSMPTEYDQPIDPESKAATVMITVADPLVEPRIHKCLPVGLDELYVYTQEVVAGVHDQRVGQEGWSYSYHDRLFNWPGVDGWEKIQELVGNKIELPFIDQINTMINKLAQTPHSRRSQATTWHPLKDAFHHEPPCLQRVWCQIVRSENEVFLLEMNTHWRSRDAFKAAFMNMYALTELQRGMAQAISRVSKREVRVGRYVDISDNFHLYGSYFRRGEIGGFLAAILKRDFPERTYLSDDPIVLEQFEEGRKRLERELAERRK